MRFMKKICKQRVCTISITYGFFVTNICMIYEYLHLQMEIQYLYALQDHILACNCNLFHTLLDYLLQMPTEELYLKKTVVYPIIVKCNIYQASILGPQFCTINQSFLSHPCPPCHWNIDKYTRAHSPTTRTSPILTSVTLGQHPPSLVINNFALLLILECVWSRPCN